VLRTILAGLVACAAIVSVASPAPAAVSKSAPVRPSHQPVPAPRHEAEHHAWERHEVSRHEDPVWLRHDYYRNHWGHRASAAERQQNETRRDDEHREHAHQAASPGEVSLSRGPGATSVSVDRREIPLK
jgi:hypothetical protein